MSKQRPEMFHEGYDEDRAKKDLLALIDHGKKLFIELAQWGDVDQKLLDDYQQWAGIVFEVLLRMFVTSNFATVAGRPPIVTDRYSAERDTKRRLTVLEQVFIQMPSTKPEPAPAKTSMGDEVFIVHGHDEGKKQALARFLQTLGVKPVILEEVPNAGDTIIEKFEKAGGKAQFAVVLLTADDVGRSKKDKGERSRARQNVILELGWFLAHLGRQRVCVLHEEGVEIPSDIAGVVYIPFSGHWKLDLARALKKANFQFDIERIIDA